MNDDDIDALLDWFVYYVIVVGGLGLMLYVLFAS